MSETNVDAAQPTAARHDQQRGEAAIAAAFARARAEGRAALITYLTAGFPDAATSQACFRAAVDAGADIVEVGLPFSDPMMDGPIIQAANQAVLDRGTTLDEQFALIGSLQIEVPKVIMTYVTLADARGYSRFARDCATAGVDGVLLPDLPVDEANHWKAEAHQNGVATIFMASSVSTDQRLAAIGAASQGWVYAAGLLGVTGVKDVATQPSQHLVARLRSHTSLPIAVGIGVKDRASAARVAAFSDGVIVGSAIVNAMAQGDPRKAPDRVSALVAELRQGVAG